MVIDFKGVGCSESLFYTLISTFKDLYFDLTLEIFFWWLSFSQSELGYNY